MVTLNSVQQQAVMNLARELRTASPGDLITRFPPRPGLRDIPGFRARVPAGGPTPEWVSKNLSRYESMQLNLRARTIARTETIRAANQGQKELWRQAMDSGQLRRDTQRIWITAGDSRVRQAHASVEGEVTGIEEDFSLGVDPGDEPNCRCGQAIAPRKGVGVPGTQPGSAPTETPWPVADSVIRTRISDPDLARLTTEARTWERALTPRQHEAVRSYTGGGFKAINRTLRGQMEATKAVRLAVQDIDEAIARAPSVGDRVVWRNDHLPRGLKPGDTVRLSGYQSTTVDPSVTGGFSSRPENVLMEIRVRGEGAFVRTLSRFDEELEIVLPRDKDYIFRGWKDIQMEVDSLGPHGPVKRVKDFRVAQLEMIG
jgi:hypothetical protein